MRVNAHQLNKTKVRDAEIEDVREFTYLESVISRSGGTDEDIQPRKRQGQQAFAILKPVWRSKALRTNTKIRIFNSNVKSILLYGTRQEPMERTVTTRRWKWIGHTLRKNKTNVNRQALDWNPQGHRKRGRPKTTWHRDLTSDLQNIGKLAKDRK
ncbi:unnamed protein product [Mytilus coruscus]|uniref:DUF6451 domain-containing protein n=1 Tax=Mytilus coruscus TaxID=42192 RepID=A0A6J8B4B3_MYTCO|nr:unnamed protein product [Mytilus coruscus]